MPNAAELLMEDHRGVRRLLVRLEDEFDRDVFETLLHDVRVHTEAEERFLYPVLHDIPRYTELADRAAEEHVELHRALDRLANAAFAERAERLVDVRLAFERHVRMEEAELLPTSQDEFGEARMLELGRELEVFIDAH